LTRFVLVTSGEDAEAEGARQDVRSGLLRAGYSLGEASGGLDAEIRVELEPTDHDATSVVGSRRLSLRLFRRGVVVAWLVMPFDSDKGRVEEVRDLVDRLTTSVALSELVEAVRAARPAIETQLARGAGASDEVPAQEAMGLRKTAMRRCRNERIGEWCDRLARYVESSPDGRDVDAARAILQLVGYPTP